MKKGGPIIFSIYLLYDDLASDAVFISRKISQFFFNRSVISYAGISLEKNENSCSFDND